MGRSQADIALAWLSAQLDLIEAMDDGPEKTEAILELAQLPALAGRFQAVRRAEVIRLRKVERLSLGKTALRTGMSKGRVQQLAEEAGNG